MTTADSQMERRRFLRGLVAGVLAAPVAAGAQEAGPVYRLSCDGYSDRLASLIARADEVVR